MEKTVSELNEDKNSKVSLRTFREYNSYLHISGLFNLIFVFTSIIVSCFYQATMIEKNPGLKDEIKKVADFSLLQIILTLGLGLINIPTLFLSLDADFSFLSLKLITFGLIGVQVLFSLIYFKQFRRAQNGLVTSYPFSRFGLSSKLLEFVESINNPKGDEVK